MKVLLPPLLQSWHLTLLQNLLSTSTIYISEPDTTTDMLLVLGDSFKYFTSTKPSRGFVYDFGRPVIFSHGPSEIMRNPTFAKILMLDANKAENFKGFPERQVNILETVEEVKRYVPTTLAAVDIETSKPKMTHLGWATDPHEAFVVLPDIELLLALRPWLESPTPKLFHNGGYDIGFIWFHYGIAVRGWTHDTQLIAHARHSEFLKNLGFVSSIYTEMPRWKFLSQEADK